MAKKEIKYYWGEQTLFIDLGNRINLRIKVLYFCEFILTSFLATIFLIKSIPLKASFFHLAYSLGASFLYLLAARRFIKRIFLKESLLLDANSLTIAKKSLFSNNIKRYYWWNIGTLHYEGKIEKTDHPLKGKSFDYLGFETQEHLIQSLHHSGNLYFDTIAGRVYFASGVYSWDAEEMVQMMKLFTGTKLKLGPEWEQMLQEQEFDDGKQIL